MPAEVLILDVGLAVACLGLVATLRPLRRLGLSTRGRGLGALLAGLAVASAAALLPTRPLALVGPPMRLDAVIPEYQFGEAHEILVLASRDRVWRATLEVTADEIRLYRGLTWLRAPHLGGAREGILNPGRRPILESALASGFLELEREEGTEVVFGTVVCCAVAPPATAEEFLRLEAPDLARAIMNFHLAAEGDGIRLRTQTRVHVTSPDAAMRFAVYWRLIYPGSAFIRRMWLDAIRRRAEGGR